MARKSQGQTRSGFYREAPFWSWNDVMDEREACRQIDEMAAGGWGGFFMHARPGLVTEYMGRQWMKVIKACVAHAKKRGMCAYLYDENRWPSGFAGGAVPRKGAKYRAKYLMLSENLCEDGANCKYITSFTTTGEGARLEAKTVEPDAKPEGAPVYHLYRYTAGLGDPWFLGSSYVDLLDPDTTAEFIRVTHEPYRKAVGGEFGKTVAGIFTDEPSLPFARACPGVSVPWTTKLPGVFEKRRGYDIMAHLPALFLPCGDYRKVRYDFYRTVTEMFVEGFMHQIFDWCEKYGLALTGHMMAEDSISSQVKWVGAVMPFYEYMHMPGMDHLGRNVANPATAKQVSSVADQLGRRRVLSELYGCSGQHLDLRLRKWIADWHFALGVNLLNPHLWLYTMRGARKRDFPPTISYQQPHWVKSPRLSDRNALVSYLLSRGRRIVDVLVVHPVESGWCEATPMDENALAENDRRFAALVDTLLENQIDFHFGDESLMAKHGSVEDGALAVGEGRYKAVVVPECLTLRYSTARLLANFAKAGGTLIVIGSRPTLVEGSRSGTAVLREALASAPVVDLPSLPALLRDAGAAPVSVTGKGARRILYHLRDLGKERLLFVANTDPDKPAAVTVEVQTGDSNAGLLSTSSHKTTALEAKRARGGLRFKLDLAAAGSAVVALGDTACPKAKKAPGKPSRTRRLAGKWRVAGFDRNALTLDYVRLPDAAGGPTAPQYVLFAAEKLRSGRKAAARYEFTVEEVPEGPVQIAVERPEEWEITLNGAPVAKPEGYFVDTAFETIDVTGSLAPGRNVIELRGVVKDDFELESIYLLGDFGVYDRGGAFHVGAPPETIDARDLTRGGFPFFAGAVDLEKTFELEKAPRRARLVLNTLQYGAAEVSVNGRAQGDLLYPPYEVELQNLRKGGNRVTITLYSTLRNLLGPHHFKGPEIEWVSPRSFTDRQAWTDEYRFVRIGFTGARIETW